ncbi:hypothetical protein FXO38_33759 [Capsicum annuum]|nr:hypothetical protein FXO38_33759 [Capsicum annuum]KAF3654270.1 hypothetical protein FXO37_16580 [Capsicum annuum]
MNIRKEEPLEKFLKTQTSFKDFGGEKSYRENGQWRGHGCRGGLGRGRSYINKFNNDDKNHLTFRGRSRGQRGGRGRGSYQVYAHVPHQGRAKLDDRSIKYVFIGYDTNLKGFKLYNPSSNKVVVSRDVEFDEEAP